MKHSGLKDGDIVLSVSSESVSRLSLSMLYPMLQSQNNIALTLEREGSILTMDIKNFTMIFSKYILTISSLVLLSSSVFSQNNGANITESIKESNSLYTLDMRGVDIREFINTISKMIGKTIITDSKVRGKVDIQSPAGLTSDELYEIFLVQLGINGFSVVDTQNGLLKVIPSQGAKLEGTRISEGSEIGNSEALVTRIVEVKNVNANQLAATLRPLIDPRLGIIAAYDTSNVILVTDRSSNVRRIAQIIAKVDQADSQTLELIPLYNASAAELERILKNLTQQANGKQAVSNGSIITSDQRTKYVNRKSRR